MKALPIVTLASAIYILSPSAVIASQQQAPEQPREILSLKQSATDEDESRTSQTEPQTPAQDGSSPDSSESPLPIVENSSDIPDVKAEEYADKPADGTPQGSTDEASAQNPTAGASTDEDLSNDVSEETAGAHVSFSKSSDTENVAPSKNGWVVEGENTYFYVNGKMLTGWQTLVSQNGKEERFHFDESGAMSHGWVREQDGTTYWCDLTDGRMLTGELNIYGKWYSFDGSTGVMRKGWATIKGKRYWYDLTDGHMLFRNQNIYGRWYWFDRYEGYMHTGSTFIDGKWYWYDLTDGHMLFRNQNIYGRWYWYDENAGYMHTGWTNIDGNWYWYDLTQGYMLFGWQNIYGVMRYFNPLDGICDKYGYQNPYGLYRVSTITVGLPSYATPGSQFSYVTPSRINANADRNQCIETMISRAYEYLGTPYRWDYSSRPGVGVDCAGLVMQALYATGMNLSPMNPWDHFYTPNHDQYANRMWNDNRFMHLPFSMRQRGDLICYPGHIAIYLGNDQIIEANVPAVRISSVYSTKNIRGVLRPFV